MTAPNGNAYCRVCLHPLDWYEGPVGPGRWVHPFAVALDAEHEVEPVESGARVADEAIGHCDFCNEIDPAYEYPCADFTIVRTPGLDVPGAGVVDRSVSAGAWAACERCAALIDAGNALGLAHRVASRPVVPASDRRDFEQLLVGLYRRFMAARQGERVTLWPAR